MQEVAIAQGQEYELVGAALSQPDCGECSTNHKAKQWKLEGGSVVVFVRYFFLEIKIVVEPITVHKAAMNTSI